MPIPAPLPLSLPPDLSSARREPPPRWSVAPAGVRPLLAAGSPAPRAPRLCAWDSATSRVFPDSSGNCGVGNRGNNGFSLRPASKALLPAPPTPTCPRPGVGQGGGVDVDVGVDMDGAFTPPGRTPALARAGASNTLCASPNTFDPIRTSPSRVASLRRTPNPRSDPVAVCRQGGNDVDSPLQEGCPTYRVSPRGRIPAGA